MFITNCDQKYQEDEQETGPIDSSNKLSESGDPLRHPSVKK